MNGARDVNASDELFDAIPAINISVHYCKAVSKNSSEHGSEFIEFRELKLLLQTLGQLF